MSENKLSRRDFLRVSALTAAGALDLSQAAKLVHHRGQFMESAVPQGKGTMAAIIGLDTQAIAKACEEASSMGIVEIAKRELKNAIRKLPDDAKFNIIVYNEAIDAFAPLPVLKTEEHVEKARSYIRSITARGGTNIEEALRFALDDLVTALQ